MPISQLYLIVSISMFLYNNIVSRAIWGCSSTVRALPCHGRGCGFESRHSRQLRLWCSGNMFPSQGKDRGFKSLQSLHITSMNFPGIIFIYVGKINPRFYYLS